MKSERLLDIIGLVDDELINRAEMDIKQGNNSNKYRFAKWNYKKIAIAASLAICCLVAVSQLTPVAAVVDYITEWVQQVTRNYNMGNLNSYRISVNQSKSVNGITMTTDEVILEENLIIAKCSFSYDDKERKDDFVQTSEWPFCVAVSQEGKNLIKIENPDDIVTSAYNEADGSIKVIFAVNLKSRKEVSDLIGKETILSFYYNRGELEGKSFDFKFVPKRIYKEESYSLMKNYNVDSYGCFTVNCVTKEALYLKVDIQSKLVCSANEEFNFRLVDQDGKEYYQQKKTDDGKYYFTRPDSISRKLYLELILIKFNNEGASYNKTVVGKYPLSEF